MLLSGVKKSVYLSCWCAVIAVPVFKVFVYGAGCVLYYK